MTASGRYRPDAAVAGFSAWQSAKLGQPAEIGQKQTVTISTLTGALT